MAKAKALDSQTVHLRVHPPLNLPVPVTDFIGRGSEIAEAGALLECSRLLTLTGPGGSGKTRLSIELAQRHADSFADGVVWVELAPLQDPALVQQALAAVLGVRSQSGSDLTAALLEHLRDRQLLLVLDNCEHLVGACALLATALLGCGKELKILASSRELLGVAGEVSWLVPPLSLPAAHADVEGISSAESVQLFVARAQAALPSFRLTRQNSPAVARICQRLDGIPLAIELAAARVRVLAPEQIVERLDHSFHLLTLGSRTAVPRQQTLRAAMDWSHALLDQWEAALFRRLSVFSGTFTLPAVEATCAGGDIDTGEVLDLLTRLVDKSLVSVASTTEVARYYLLETIRQYAAERLHERPEEADVRDRHARHFLRLAEEAEPQLLAAQQSEWMDRLEADHDNLRGALRHLLGRGDPAEAARLGGAIWRFWHTRGYLTEGRRWLEEVLAHPGFQQAGDHEAATWEAARAKALRGAGVLAWSQGDYRRAAERFEEALALVRKLGDEDGIASLYNNLGVIALHHADYARASELFAASLALRRAQGDAWGIATSLNNLGATAGKQGDAARAREFYEESLALQRSIGNTQGTALCLSNLAAVAYSDRDWARAEQLYEESLALRRHLGDKTGIADALGKLGAVALHQGAAERARELYRESLPLLRELGDKERIAGDLVGIADLALAQARPAQAVRLLGAAEAIRDAIGAPVPPAEQEEQEQSAAAARAALGEAVFAAGWAEGRALSLEQALELAADWLHAEAPATPAAQPAPATASAAPAAAAAPARAAELSIRALGPMEVWRGGSLVSAAEWGSAKPRELLFFLLGQPGGRSKEQIGLALWPDASPSQLRSSFHFTLHHLRRALGRPEWISFENDRYGFNRTLPYEYDVERFEQHVARAEQLRRTRTTPPAEAIQSLQEAVRLHRGDFLEGAVFGEWVEERRAEIRRRYEGALLTLAELLLDENSVDEAAEAFRRALAHDNLLESAHRGLMRCLARQGERERALRHYPVLVTLLREELGTEPDPTTTALYDRLRRGEDV